MLTCLSGCDVRGCAGKGYVGGAVQLEAEKMECDIQQQNWKNKWWSN